MPSVMGRDPLGAFYLTSLHTLGAYVGALNLAGLGEGKTLLGAAVSLQFRHNESPSICFSACAENFVLLTRLRGEEHGHVSALELGCFVQRGNFGAELCELLEQITSDVRVGHFASAETDGNLHPVAIGQELLCVFQLGVEIPNVNARRHTDLLDLHHMLVLSCFLLPLALLELILAVVHQFADRGGRLGGNLHQIQALFISDVQRLRRGNDAQLLAGFADQADLRITDLFIEFML